MERARPNPLDPFLTLRAEEEGDWLAECFVAPEDFERMVGGRSIVVFGRPGAGKSALCRMVERKARENCRLPVRWSPLEAALLSTEETALPAHLSEVFDACGRALLEHLSRSPTLDNVPAWAMQMLRWFIHRFVRGYLYARAGHLLSENRLPQPFTAFFTPPKKDLLPSDDYPLILAELSKALHAAGLEGIWVLVDIGNMGNEETANLLASLKRLLSALPL